MNESKIKQEWAKRGYSFGISKNPPSKIWSDFIHATDEIIMLVQGKIEIQFQNKKMIPKPGEEVIIPAGEKHTVKNIGENKNIWFYGYRFAVKNNRQPEKI